MADGDWSTEVARRLIIQALRASDDSAVLEAVAAQLWDTGDSLLRYEAKRLEAVAARLDAAANERERDDARTSANEEEA